MYREKADQSIFHRCIRCMHELSAGTACPSCGFDVKDFKLDKKCLEPYTLLQDRYVIGDVIGAGGFGITYIGWDTNLNITIAVKEYFPADKAERDVTSATGAAISARNGKHGISYEDGLKRFVHEAEILSRFHQAPGIVSVRDFFRANQTAYIIMEYLQGITLRHYVEENGPMSLDEIFDIMTPISQALEKIHQAGVLHRDISPDNIMMTLDGQVKLLDFGSAKDIALSSSKTMTVVLKRGFAPAEQYQPHGIQGAWTDIYAFCGTIYYLLTGTEPPDSLDRTVYDILMPPSDMGAELPPRVEHALLKGMAIDISKRYETMDELMGDFLSDEMGSTAPSGFPVQKKSLILIAVLFLLAAGAYFLKRDTPSSAPKADAPLPVSQTATGSPAALYAEGSPAVQEAGASPEPEYPRMPRLSGKKLKQAKKLLRQAGVSYSVQRKHNKAAKGTVIHQHPKAGKTLKEDVKIILTVSLGPQPVPSLPAAPTPAPAENTRTGQAGLYSGQTASPAASKNTGSVQKKNTKEPGGKDSSDFSYEEDGNTDIIPIQ